jgi:lysophospholipase L1-like esterase
MKSIIKIIIILFFVELFLQSVTYYRFLNSARQAYRGNILLNNWYTKKNDWWIRESSKLIPTYNPFLAFIFQDIHLSGINHDSAGARFTDGNPRTDSGNYKKIFLFGGSTLAGWGVKDGETIPSYIAKKLNTPVNKYLITNYGQYAYNSNQELLYLILQLKNGNIPDLVIFYDGCNDLGTASKSTGNHLDQIENESGFSRQMGSFDFTFHLQSIDNTSLINAPVLSRIVKFLTTYIKLIHYPVELANRMVNYLHRDRFPEKQPDMSFLEKNVNSMVANYVSNLTVVENLSRQYHFKYVAIWQPLEHDKKLTGQELSDIDSAKFENNRILSATAAAALKNNHPVNFINLSGVFTNYSDKSLFMDYCHVTPEGNNIIAGPVGDIITEEFNQ